MKGISCEFIRFLKEKGCYRKYIRNFNDKEIGLLYREKLFSNVYVSLPSFLDAFHPFCFASEGFDKERTKESKAFWINVEKEWVSLACGLDW